MSKQKLRFKVGDRVLARCEGWQEANVMKLWSDEDMGLAPYRMRVVDTQNDIYTMEDSNDFVRPYVEPGLLRIIQCVQCKDEWDTISTLITEYKIDTEIVGGNLLLHAASAGHDEAVQALIDDYNVPSETCDKDGRNMLHLALLNKHFDLVETISECYQDVFLGVDNRGFNVIHYVVMSKDSDLLENILYNQYFDAREEHEITNAVDTHNQRYEKADSSEKVNSTISPLEWARRTKQTQMIETLERYINEQKVQSQLLNLSMNLKVVDTDADMLNEITLLMGKIKEWKLDIHELFKIHNVFWYAKVLICRCASKGFVQSVRYAVEEYFSPVIEVNKQFKERFVDHVGEFLEKGIEGPSDTRFLHMSIHSISKNPWLWAVKINLIFEKWDGSDANTFLVNELPKHVELNKNKSLHDDWPPIVVEYLEKTIARAEGVLIAERAAVLQYLLSLDVAPLEKALPVHFLVQHSQLQLLQWAARESHVSLLAPVTTCPSLVEHVRTLPWLTLERKKKKAGKSAIPGDLSVAEVLCALAAGLGEFSIFEWLLQEVIPATRRGVTFNSRDLLYIAAVQNRLVIVKIILLRKLLPSPQVFEAIAECDPHWRLYAVCSELLSQYPSTNPTRERWEALINIGVGSANDRFKDWATTESARIVCVELQGLLEQKAPLEDLLASFEKFNLDVDWWYHSHVYCVTEEATKSAEAGERVTIDSELDNYFHDFKRAEDKVALLSCLITYAVRADNLAFLDHVVTAVGSALTIAQASRDHSNFVGSFVAMLRDLRVYALGYENVFIASRLAEIIETLSLANRAVVVKPEKIDNKPCPFNQLNRLLRAGASIEVLEECVVRQKEAAVDMTPEELREEIVSMENLASNQYNWYAELSRDGFLHIIQWLIEGKGFKVSYKHAEEAILAAGGDHFAVVKYFLEHVYNEECREARMVPVGYYGENEDDDDEVQMKHVGFHARMAYKVTDWMYDIGVHFAYSRDEIVLETTEPRVAVLQYLLGFALRNELYTSENPDSCFKIVFDALQNLQQRAHPDMWVFVKQLMSVKALRDTLYHKERENVVLKIAEDAFRLSFMSSKADLSQLRGDYCEHSAEIISCLLDHGLPHEQMMKFLIKKGTQLYRMDELRCLDKLVRCAFAHAIDIQGVIYTNFTAKSDRDEMLQLFAALDMLKATQRQRWTIADAVAAGRSVEQLRQLLEGDGNVDVHAARDRVGRNLIQVAALHDRADVIMWLHKVHRMDIKSLDRNGLSVLMLCRGAGSLNAARVVAETIGGDLVRSFCYRHFHRRRILTAARLAHSRRVAACVLIQRCLRGRSVRLRYAPLLREVKGSWEAFLSKWGAVLVACKEISAGRQPAFSWAEQKFKFDMAVDISEREGESDTTVQNLLDQAAVTTRLEVSNTDAAVPLEKLAFTQLKLSSEDSPASVEGEAAQWVDAVELSQAVVGWLHRADEAYRAMFHKKVARLAQGGRSYALSKRLKHCEYPICESKLDAGQRILWTYISRDNKQHVLIWFVSKHDNVSHCAKMIDSACSRTFRSLNRVASIDNTSTADNNSLTLTEDSVLLDPSRNVPMKIYIAQRAELPLLAEKSWKAPLRLNQREQGVRSQAGTVLLLGRSGTGKTLCVMDRMNHDRKSSTYVQQSGGDVGTESVRQLFVTRSSALCDFVRLYQQHHCGVEELTQTDFSTFEHFLQKLEANNSFEQPTGRTSNKKVDFQRFRDTVFPLLTTAKSTRTALDPLVVWTQIRSFLKGSIEASLQGGVLSRAAYLDTAQFSRDRCRLLLAQREEVYALFVQYQALHELHGWWDDMDRAMQLLLPNLSALQSGSLLDEASADAHPRYSKVYVDEVQDNTQVEIALYLVAVSGRVDALFLAGDPAQSVVEGVEFRFEEVRSLVYLLCQRQEALQRPTKLLVNYRSHSGILNCAGAVLGRMLAMFPGAAKTLPADEGLFLGPRPAFHNAASMADLTRLLAGNERLVVLCPDERAMQVSVQLLATGSVVADSVVAKQNLVLGVRAAKGLEFSDIVLLDFFSAIPDSDYKAWKELLAVGTDGAKGSQLGELQQYAFPQLEPQLKLLHTAITRCINRLIFVESQRSRIGGLFFRWLKQHGLADAFAATTTSKSAVLTPGETEGREEGVAGAVSGLMTRDEWRMRGIDISLSAEGSPDLERAVLLLDQAALCFQRAEEPVLKAITTAQLALMQAEAKHCGAISVPHTARELSSAEEVAVAGVVLRGMRVGLHGEAHRLCRLLEDRVSAQSKKYFVSDLLLVFE